MVTCETTGATAVVTVETTGDGCGDRGDDRSDGAVTVETTGATGAVTKETGVATRVPAAVTEVAEPAAAETAVTMGAVADEAALPARMRLPTTRRRRPSLATAEAVDAADFVAARVAGADSDETASPVSLGTAAADPGVFTFGALLDAEDCAGVDAFWVETADAAAAIVLDAAEETGDATEAAVGTSAAEEVEGAERSRRGR